MSQDATSFFRGISAKISAAKQSYSSKVRRRREEEEEPQQPVLPPTPPPSSSTTPMSAVSSGLMGRNGGSGVVCSSSSLSVRQEHVNGTLMTQVRQTATATYSDPILLPGSDADRRGSNDSSGRGDSMSSSNNNSSSAMKPKVHVSAVVERTRKIQGMPKNTSPIIARNHASLLPPPMARYRGKKTLILDLDETLVHSSLAFQPKQYNLVLNLRVENSNTTVYVAYRPHLHDFMRAVAPLFEVIIFTASVAIYCNPLMDAVDADGILGSLRLYREHCSMLNGAYVKDLSLLGRDLDQVAIVDNSPVAYLFQQRNAIPITSWFDDLNDSELMRLVPMLEALAQAPDVYDVLDKYNAVLQLQQEQMRPDDGQM